MSISSTSTFTQVLAQYNDNLSWDNDLTKATLALEAVRWLLVSRPENMSRTTRNFSYSDLEKELERLTKFVNNQTSGVKSGSKRGFRMSHVRPGGSRG